MVSRALAGAEIDPIAMKAIKPILQAALAAAALLASSQVVRAQQNCYYTNCPPNMTVPCQGPWGAVVWFNVFATNICNPSQPPTITYSQPPGSIFPPGSTIVCANIQIPGVPAVSCCWTVTVDTCCGDNCIKLVCPPNFVYPCDPAQGGGALVDLKQPQFQPYLTNLCGGPVPSGYVVGCSITPLPTGPTLFPPGETTIICCVTNLLTDYVDCCCYKIIVLTNCLPTILTNCVTVICPTNVEVCVTNGLCTNIANLPVPILTNTCGQQQPIILGAPGYTMPPGSCFPLGKTTVGVCVKWVLEALGGTIFGTNCCCFDVVVKCCTNCQSTLVCPPDMVLPCPGPNGIPLIYNAYGTNPCYQTFLDCVPTNGTIIFGNTNVCCKLVAATPVGPVVLTQCCFKVTVKCPTNCVPVIICPSNIFITCAGPRGAYVPAPAITVTDTCPAVKILTVFCNPPLPGFFPIGCTPVTCTAVDAGGAVSSCSFKVCVRPVGCYLKNPSFELIVANPQPANACGLEPVDNAQSWSTLSGAPALFRVPANCWGNEVACDGTNYAGIGSTNTAAGGFGTDEMLGRLTVPLVNGKAYRLKGCLSLAEASSAPGVMVQFVLANQANPLQQFVINQTWVYQKVGWQPVQPQQPPCFIVPQGTNVWDALIIRAAQVSTVFGVGLVYIDNVNICCCNLITVGTLNPTVGPTLDWAGPGGLLQFSPRLVNPGGMMTLGRDLGMDPDTGMSMVQFPGSFFDTYPMGFFRLIAPEPMMDDCGCYP